jgi:ribosomal protein S18 acetylase RimI-like enzyme
MTSGDYRLIAAAPPVDDYLALRELAGLTPRRPDQAKLAIQGSWFAVHVVHEPNGTVVAMGRVLGDGGWYFHIADMAVLPEHQRRGLGNLVLQALLDQIRNDAPPGAFVSLLADGPGRALYRRHNFIETAPGSLGMARLL